MIQVISALRIEENHRSSLNVITPSKVNLVENQSQNKTMDIRTTIIKIMEKIGRRGRVNSNIQIRTIQIQYPNKNHSNPNDKPKGSNGKVKLCYVCGRTNHLAKDCFYKKTEPFKQRKN